LIGPILAGVTFLAARGPAVFAETFGDYVGWKACAECHEDAAAGWKKTRHAQAFEHLKNEGKEDVPGCVGCHAVHFDEEGGFIDLDLTPELAGVQCESCHGPGKKHVEKRAEGDNIVARPDRACCRRCHTPGQDANFDYEKKVLRVHGP
jgi:hypothetical protein